MGALGANLPSADFCILTEVHDTSSRELFYGHGEPRVAVPSVLIGGVDEVGHDAEAEQDAGDEGASELRSAELPRAQYWFDLEYHDVMVLINE